MAKIYFTITTRVAGMRGARLELHCNADREPVRNCESMAKAVEINSENAGILVGKWIAEMKLYNAEFVYPAGEPLDFADCPDHFQD